MRDLRFTKVFGPGRASAGGGSRLELSDLSGHGPMDVLSLGILQGLRNRTQAFLAAIGVISSRDKTAKHVIDNLKD